jgi:predicted transcriptional regulator
MSDLLTPADVERMAWEGRISIAELCRRAGVAPSIFSRWKAGKTEPSMENYRRIRDVAQAARPKNTRGRRPSPESDTTPPSLVPVRAAE